MRTRPSARLLPIDTEGKLLLFRYALVKGDLTGASYWATAGGGLEEGETYEEAARRELREETGFAVDAVGAPVAERDFVLELVTGETVLALERYFAFRIDRRDVTYTGWTELEKQFMLEHRWWSLEELRGTRETLFPEGLPDILEKCLSGGH